MKAIKYLQDILVLNSNLRIIGEPNPPIRQLQTKASLVERGDVFIARKGLSRDGHEFIDEAIKRGARVIVGEQQNEYVQNLLDIGHNSEITYCIVPDTTQFATILFHNYYPEIQKLKIVGITGTNGKTTIATLLYQAFRSFGYKTGLLSTIRVMIDCQEIAATHTTPDIQSLYSLLAQMYAAGCSYVFMECSSHAIVQNRIGGINFCGAVFTNLTHDHLDYHGSFRAYIDAKKSFFDQLKSTAFALSNIDDKHGNYVLQNTAAIKKTYALRQVSDFRARVLVNNLDGLTLEYFNNSAVALPVNTRLIGLFNAYNLLAVYGVCELLLGLEAEKIWTILSKLKGADGRLELEQYRYPVNFMGIIDYAHTPDSLEQTLKTLYSIKKAKIVLVFGCGGNRDRQKRPIMTQIGLKYADILILTADNPRHEPVADILGDMIAELSVEDMQKIHIQAERRKAIKFALENLGTGDILLIAGKGHEKYQEIAGHRYPFDDRQVLNELVNTFSSNE